MDLGNAKSSKSIKGYFSRGSRGMVAKNDYPTGTKSASDIVDLINKDTNMEKADNSDFMVTLVPSDISSRHRAKPV